MKSVLGIGNALVDVLAVAKDEKLLKKYGLPKGSMQHVSEQKANEVYCDLKEIGASVVTGGSAANTIAGLSQLGMRPGFIGKVGNDELGNFYNADLKKLKVRSHLVRGEKSTGRAMVVISPDSERTFAVYLGAAIEMTPEDINPSIFDGYTYVHIEGYLVQNHDLIETVMKIAHEKGKIVSIDLASYNVVEENVDFLHQLIKNYANIVFANAQEAKAFTGENPERALLPISRLCDIVVIKIGSRGSWLKEGTRVYHIPTRIIEDVDFTGAGDLYAAGFLYGMAMKKEPHICGEIGTICACEVIQVVGTKMSANAWKNIHTRIGQIEENEDIILRIR
ncbi:MAG: adenosine kinase [Prevotellaceae bacterium]|jgi:sugar/nucleoside kinase (ribokinase family)|nr:adenosine kinase [Prevotellaceae bacterium]